MKDYCRCVEEYYRAQYREGMFEGESLSLLPEDCRFALAAAGALKKIEEGALSEGARLFKEAVGLCPTLSGVIREALRQVAAGADAPPAPAGEEFAQLAVQMKEAVRGMIGNRQYAEALAVIQQLQPLLPDDLEILKMRQKALRESKL